MRKRRSSPLPFLLLNIIVSALTTLVVLVIWNAAHTQPVTTTTNSQTVQQPISSSSPTPLPALDKPQIDIQTVIGAGDLQNEVVQIKRVGDTALNIAGWRLDDGQGHQFTFPNMVLNPGGMVSVYTKAGGNSVFELHWGLSNPVWNKGSVVSVYDPQNNLRASKTIE